MTQPAILFAHGAGAPSSSEWMRGWTERLQVLGPVAAFDYTYMREGRKRPDRPDKLLATHRVALEQLRSGHSGPIVLAGKSMGGRMGCHLALTEDGCSDSLPRLSAGLAWPLTEDPRRSPPCEHDSYSLCPRNPRPAVPSGPAGQGSGADERSYAASCRRNRRPLTFGHKDLAAPERAHPGRRRREHGHRHSEVCATRRQLGSSWS